ncbi:hypothetical protein DFR28_1138 [Arenicella xantha]|uniref:Uncharacterized protein n=1 Tax=Arenicella xantha TaxID=644221 RepID=A0A395JEC6_9GAMM|nr:hypothetical protein DFR28_1138 [Arenicella xantha]
MFSRVRCRSCKEKIGHHWLLAAIFFCLEFFILLILGLYLIKLSYSLSLSLLFYGMFIFSVTFLWSLFGPLEQKNSQWEP